MQDQNRRYIPIYDFFRFGKMKKIKMKTDIFNATLFCLNKHLFFAPFFDLNKRKDQKSVSNALFFAPSQWLLILSAATVVWWFCFLDINVSGYCRCDFLLDLKTVQIILWFYNCVIAWATPFPFCMIYQSYQLV